MKKILICSLVLVVFACNNRQNTPSPPPVPTPENKPQIEAEQKPEPEQGIKGKWIIKRYYFARISPMDKEMAEQWVNRTLTVTDKAHFTFDRIDAYKDAFKKEEDECNITNMDNPETTGAKDYFDWVNDPVTELKVTNTTLKIYKTDCKDHPFKELTLTSSGKLIATWDGVFFCA